MVAAAWRTDSEWRVAVGIMLGETGSLVPEHRNLTAPVMVERMSQEGGPERTQRTVAELLAKYGSGTGDRPSRRRRRRPDDVSDTGAQAIIERVLSESGELAAIQPDQPAPQRTSHRRGQPPRTPPPPPLPPRAAPPPPASPSEAAASLSHPALRPVQPEPGRPPPSMPGMSSGTRPPVELPAGPPRALRRAQSPPPLPPRQPPTLRARLDGPADDVQLEPTTEELPRIGLPDEYAADRTPPAPPPAAEPPQHRTGPQGHLAFPTAAAAQEALAASTVLSAGTPTQFTNGRADDLMDGVAGDGLDGAVGYADPYYPEDEHPDYPAQDEDYGYADEFGDDIDLEPEPDELELAEDENLDDLDDTGASSPAKEWLVLAGQLALGALGGAAVWLSFNWLWGRLPQVAPVVALAVVIGLVFIVRKIRRADDTQTTVLAVLAGLAVTASPGALLLLGQ